jgi:TonB-linked SusC/RagA family outer membrane protein
MKRIISFITLLMMVLIASAQDRTITGTVTDAATGEPLPGVSIVLQGTTRGTVTDLDGVYTIDASDDQVLMFSFVGYLEETVTIQGQNTIDIALAADLQSLEEIIVVGYGTQKKSLVTGAIAKVNSESIEQARVTRVESALQGRTSGVLVQQTSGAPGAEQNVIIRGAGSDNNVRPLYVIDGMRTDGIDWLDPEDIESMEVLKDAASAAIYGTEGANGVIIITTKTGKDGKTVLTYNGSYGFQDINSGFAVMNTPQYQDYYRYAYMNDRNRTYDEAVTAIPDSAQNTDWLGAIYKEPALTKKHKIGVTGGNEKSQYYFSLSYTDQEGVVGGEDKSRFTRYATKLNLDSDATNWLKVGGRISYTYTEKKGISQNGVFGSITNNAVVLDPTAPIYFADTTEYESGDITKMRNAWGPLWYENPGIQDGNGYYGISQEVQNEISNPVQQLGNDRDKDQINKIIGGVYGEIKFYEDLKFRSTFDIDYAHIYNRGWNPRTYANSLKEPVSKSRAFQNMNLYYTWQWEGYFSYNKTISEHVIGAVLGASSREFRHEYLGGHGDELIDDTDNFAWIDYGLYIDTLHNTSYGGLGNWQRQSSLFGRITYSYKDKYMLTSNIRRDGDSRFGPEKKFGVFPSLSLGWVISRESFWNLPAWNFLKARYSFGITGNAQSLDWRWAYLPKLNQGSYYYPTPTDKLQAVTEAAGLVNEKYAWEEVQQHNFGFDMGFLQNKVTFTFDWYDKRHTSIEGGFLMVGATSDAHGNTPPTVNAGIIQNTGVEFDLSYKDNFGDWYLGIQATASRNKSEVLSMANDNVFLGGNLGTFGASKRFAEGYEPWYFWGFESDGIFTSQAQLDAHVNDDGDLLQPNAELGDVVYIDVAGPADADGNPTGPDGVIDDNDKTYLGSPYPKWITGLNITVEYKGFDFNMYTYASIGNKTLSAVSIRTDLPNTNKPDYYLTDAWISEDQPGTFPRPTTRDRNKNFSRVNEFLLQDGSLLRISNLTLGYTIPKSLTEQAGISKFRIYGAIDNLATFTKYKGMEPEVGGDYYGYQGQQWAGIDRAVYPRPRTFIVGLNLTF